MENNIDNAIFLDANLRSNSKGLTLLCKLIESFSEDAGIITNWTPNRSRHLELFALNMLVQARQDPSRYVIYQRNKNFYSLKRYFNMSHRPAVDIADLLLSPKLGLADGIKAETLAKQEAAIRKAEEDELDKSTEKSKIYSSRIRASPKLLDYADHYGLSIAELNPYQQKNREVVILKGSDKRLCDYDETDETLEMRTGINIVNAHVSRHFIGLCMFDEHHDEMNKRLLENSKIKYHDEIPQVIDYTRKLLYRVFNNGSFEQGGRFYGGWWQSVPSDYRPYLRIDDEITVEPDFTAIHIKLIYAMAGEQIPCTDDPFILDGLTIQSRKFMKALFNIMLNSPSREDGIGALRGEWPEKKVPKELPGTNYHDLLDIFLCQYPLLTQYLGTGEGVNLQFMDSAIAEHVMLSLIEQDIPLLPIHDSFIVKLKDQNKLIQAMEEAVYKLHETTLGIKMAETEVDWVYAEGLADDVGGNPEKYVQRSPSLNRKLFTKYFAEYDRWQSQG